MEAGKVHKETPPTNKKRGYYNKADVDKLAEAMEDFIEIHTTLPEGDTVELVQAEGKDDIRKTTQIARQHFGDNAYDVEKRMTWFRLAPNGDYVLKHGDIIVGYISMQAIKPEAEMLTVRETIDIMIDMDLENFGKQMKEADNDNQALYTIFEMKFNIPSGTYFVDSLGTKQNIKQLIVIGHYNREDTELVNMRGVSYGPAQVAFGKTSKVDAKSLVSIVEHENGPNTGAIMIQSNNDDTIKIIDLREVKE